MKSAELPVKEVEAWEGALETEARDRLLLVDLSLKPAPTEPWREAIGLPAEPHNRANVTIPPMWSRHFWPTHMQLWNLMALGLVVIDHF
jgi:hypothetical protein